MALGPTSASYVCFFLLSPSGIFLKLAYLGNCALRSDVTMIFEVLAPRSLIIFPQLLMIPHISFRFILGYISEAKLVRFGLPEAWEVKTVAKIK